MSTEIVIDVQGYTTRVAVLENKRLVELFVEDEENPPVIGNIYKGVVKNIFPGMEAAFVDIGLGKNAFLYLRDLSFGEEMVDELMETSLEEGFDPEEVRTNLSVKSVPQIGQEMLLQVVKEALGNKGVKVDSHITLAGRYLVLTPTTRRIGVSRRITSEEERSRLEKIMEGLAPPKMGLIARTNATGKDGAYFENELKILLNRWHKIKRYSKKASSGSLIYKELPLPLRVIRDIFTEQDRIIINSPEYYQRIIEFMEELQLGYLQAQVSLDEEDKEIFGRLGIESEIAKALSRKIWLKCGGYILIDELEALVAIDVNSGKYTGSKDPEKTILKVNLEAAKEVADQLRLRNLGGIIIVDFINMEQEKSQKRLMATLEKELSRDRVRYHLLPLTPLGLVEITRKKSTPSLDELLCQDCPTCHGGGRVLSLKLLESRLISRIRNKVKRADEEFLIKFNPEVCRELRKSKKIQELEEDLKIKIEFSPDEELNWNEMEILYRV
ncbi:TPA: ribonuclease E/G [bacterium]|nr:ribonuclease E/G [bacterium]